MHTINVSIWKLFHLGLEIIRSLKSKDTNNLESCDFILCTGLFDDHENDLEYYKIFLKSFQKLICTNPDLTVIEE